MKYKEQIKHHPIIVGVLLLIVVLFLGRLVLQMDADLEDPYAKHIPTVIYKGLTKF